MPHFLYMVERKPEALTGALLPQETGLLSRVMDGHMDIAIPTPDGTPGGLPGVLIRPDVPMSEFPIERFRLCPEQQTWRVWKTREDGTRIWCGMWDDWCPRPRDLVRKQTFNGVTVKLEDGEPWNIPVLKFLTNGRSGLPSSVEFTEDGETVMTPAAKYRQLSYDGERVYDTMWRFHTLEEEDVDELSLRDAVAIAARAIELNYRVTGCELSLMQVISQANMLHVCSALVGFDMAKQMAAAVKKNSQPAEDLGETGETS